jgi:hypothetical protein
MRVTFVLLSLLFTATTFAAFDPNEIPKEGVAYRVSFCARAFPDSGLGIPPHAFLALNTVDSTQKRVFHAIGTVKGTQPRALLGQAAMLSPVPEVLSAPNYAGLMQNCLVIPVSRAEYQTVEKLVNTQVGQMALTIPKTDIYGIYGLAPEDCSALFVKVVKLLPNKGLLVPKQFPSEPPIGYMRRLIDQNIRKPA